MSQIEKSKKSVLLLGARQVGKSTLIMKSLKPDLHINLAREDEFFTFQGNNLELESRIEATKRKTIFIDEIQRILRLINTIQAILDENPKLKMYLSGSSARKLKRGKANLIPGRIFTYQMTPLSLLELGSVWSEKNTMQFGVLMASFGLFERQLSCQADILIFQNLQKDQRFNVSLCFVIANGVWILPLQKALDVLGLKSGRSYKSYAIETAQ